MKTNIYALVLPSISTIPLAVTTYMDKCAKKGLLIHIMSGLYAPLKKKEGPRAKTVIARITAHNGKMGFNWIAGEYVGVGVDREYKKGGQYNSSAYRGWLADAAKYWEGVEPTLSRYYAYRSQNEFNTVPKQMQMFE